MQSSPFEKATNTPEAFESKRPIKSLSTAKVPQQRSNLSVLLEGQLCTNDSDSKPETAEADASEISCHHPVYSSPAMEADSASGPTVIRPPNKISAHLIRSAPTEISIPEIKLASSYRRAISLLPNSSKYHERPAQSPGFLSKSGNRADFDKRKPQIVRKCISSKELGSLAPPSKTSFSLTLHQRDMLQVEMQKRLQEAKQSNLSSDRSLESLTSKQDASDSSECSKKRLNRQLKNESRNKRRAEATRAVTGDLCEIVTDLFIAEAKLLNPAIYGIDTSLKRDRVYRDVLDFVSELPSRYALGVDTPSEVLLHMRLMAAARSDNTRPVVHLAKLDDERWLTNDTSRSLFLVTISSVDAQGLLEYISKLLASGGSRVLDADVMMSGDNIILDRFVVQMKGRLRLDKLSQSIEVFLAKNLEHLSETIEENSSSNSSEKVNCYVHVPRSPAKIQREAAGSLYFRPPEIIQEEAHQNLQEEIDSAVPLSQVLSSSMSAAALSNVIPMRRSSGSYSRLKRGNSLPPALMQSWGPSESPRSNQSTKSRQQDISTAGTINQDQLTDRKQRRLESREAKNFLDPEEENMARPVDYLLVDTASKNDLDQMMPDEQRVPLIPFEELMLIETLGTGRVSTIYRAAWQKVSSPGGTRTLTDVQMVALKVATVHKDSSNTLHIDELRREADIAAMLKHPNICDLVGVAADAECFCLAYEFCEGESLLNLLSNTSRYYEYLPIALDIANGMAYLHSRSVIHRDLKPSNVLLTLDHRAKISDFGMSIADRGQELTAETGTYRYMAPEVIRHESYSSNADVYSFGILLWQLITREVPFATMTPIQAAFSVAEGLRPDIPDATPFRLREIIVSCWNHDAQIRPSFTYVAMALADYARMAFSPANVGAQTLQIANEMLATVEGNSNINVDFSTPVAIGYGEDRFLANVSNHSYNVGLEI